MRVHLSPAPSHQSNKMTVLRLQQAHQRAHGHGLLLFQREASPSAVADRQYPRQSKFLRLQTAAVLQRAGTPPVYCDTQVVRGFWDNSSQYRVGAPHHMNLKNNTYHHFPGRHFSPVVTLAPHPSTGIGHLRTHSEYFSTEAMDLI